MVTESPLIIDHGKTMPTMKTGWVIVATAKGKPRRIADGRLSISEKMFGNYSLAEVDTRSRTFSESIKLPTRASGMEYDADIRVNYRVVDPIKAVARRLADMG